MIKRLTLTNYRAFRTFSLDCNEDLNIIVGNNEAGKSTILEALSLVLTKRLNGRAIELELSPHLINKKASEEYLEAIRRGDNPALPSVSLELYLTDTEEVQYLKGTNNSQDVDCPGLKLEMCFDEDYREEYIKLLDDRESITLVPTEYYKASWLSFANNPVTARALPIGLSFIDATTIRLHNGTDHYLHNIISGNLDAGDRVGLALAYRRLKEHFAGEPAISSINENLSQKRGTLTDKGLSLSIDLSRRANWETALTPHLDNIPFQLIGKGEQNALKILLALDRKVEDSHVVLIEEPENHLSFSSMNVLIDRLRERCAGKQLFICTHSAYVLNKLGIDKLILLHSGKTSSLRELPPETLDYFRKLSGYDTLRLLLARRTILVEGPSDELIVQKAYVLRYGKLPIEAGVDVLNVRGLSFARFLDIAAPLGLRVAVMTDNDGDHQKKVVDKYAAYHPYPFITVFAESNNSYSTLEPCIMSCNSRATLNEIFGTSFEADEQIIEYMTSNKTDCALKIFETTTEIRVPEYVWDAIEE